MLITIYYFLVNVVIPQILACIETLAGPMLLIAIVFAGILLLLGAVGIKISNNLGTTIIRGIFKGIRHLIKVLLRAIKWFILSMCGLIPRIFKKSRKSFYQRGMNPAVSNILAAIVVIAFVAIVI